MSNGGVITMEEFVQLNGQLVQLRTQNFDLEARMKKMNSDFQNVMKQKVELETEVKKLQVVVGTSKEKITLKKSLDDNTQLRKTMGELQMEYEEHNKALKENLKLLYQTNGELQAKVDGVAKEKDGLIKKLQEDIQMIQEEWKNRFSQMEKQNLEKIALLEKTMSENDKKDVKTVQVIELAEDQEKFVQEMFLDKDAISKQDLMRFLPKLGHLVAPIEKMVENPQHLETIDKLNQEINALKDSLTSTQSLLEETQTKDKTILEESKKQVEDQNLEISNLKEEMNKVRSDAQESINKETQGHQEELKKETKMLHEEITKIKMESTDSIDKLTQKHAQQVDSLTSQLDGKISEISTLSENFKKEIEEIKKKNTQDVKQVKEEESKKISALESELNNYKNQLDTMRNDYQESLKGLNENSSSDTIKQMETLEKQKEEIFNLKTTIEKMHNVKNDLQEKFDKLKAEKDKNDEENEKELEDLDEEIKNLKADLVKSQVTSVEIKKQLEHVITDKTVQIEALTSEIKIKNENLDKMASSHQEEVHKLSATHAENIKGAQQEIDSCKTQLVKLTGSLQTLTLQNQEAKQAEKSMSEKHQMELDSERKALETLQSKLDTLQKVHDQVLSAKDAEIHHLKESTQSNEICEAQKLEIANLLLQLETLRAEHHDVLKIKNSELAKLKETHVEQIQELVASHEKQISVQKEECQKSHLSEIEKIENLNKELESHLKYQIESLNHRLMEGEKQVTILNETHSEEVKKLKSEHAGEISKLKKAHQEALSKVSKETSESAQISVKQLQDSLKHKEEELIKVKGELATLQKDNENILASVLRLQQERQTYVSEVDTNQKKMHNLTQNLTSNQNKVKELTSANEKLIKEASENLAKMKGLEETLDKIKSEHATKLKDVESKKKMDFDNEVVKNKALSDHIVKLQKDIKEKEMLASLHEEDVKKGSMQVKSHLDTINDINNRLGIVTSEREAVLSKQKDILNQLVEKDHIIKVLNHKMNKLSVKIDKLNSEFCKLFSTSVCQNVVNKNESIELIQVRKELVVLEEESVKSKSVVESLQKDIENHDQRIKDMKLEFQSNSRFKDQQLKELKALLKDKSFLVSQSPMTPNESSGSREEVTVTTPKIQHRREGSISSGGGSDNTSEVNAKSLTGDADAQVIQKENNILLTRVGELQTSKWKLEEKLRYFTDQNSQLKDEIEKKKQIVAYYMQREKLGRLTPEQEQNKNKLGQKSQSFMGNVYSGKQQDPKVMAQTLTTLQNVMEETLLHNIQLQNNIKILGDEVQRLMVDNKKLLEDKKEKI